MILEVISDLTYGDTIQEKDSVALTSWETARDFDYKVYAMSWTLELDPYVAVQNLFESDQLESIIKWSNQLSIHARDDYRECVNIA